MHPGDEGAFDRRFDCLGRVLVRSVVGVGHCKHRNARTWFQRELGIHAHVNKTLATVVPFPARSPPAPPFDRAPPSSTPPTHSIYPQQLVPVHPVKPNPRNQLPSPSHPPRLHPSQHPPPPLHRIRAPCLCGSSTTVRSRSALAQQPARPLKSSLTSQWNC